MAFAHDWLKPLFVPPMTQPIDTLLQSPAATAAVVNPLTAGTGPNNPNHHSTELTQKSKSNNLDNKNHPLNHLTLVKSTV